MKIQLIPVVEIAGYGSGMPLPNKGPYWEYPEVWETFHRESHRQSGFPDKLVSYVPGSALYELSGLSDGNLRKLVLDTTAEMIAENYDRDLVSAFSGGYILNVNDDDKLYPQCCSDLRLIYEWEALTEGEGNFFYNGHPSPVVIIEEQTITFNMDTQEKDEQFVPPPAEKLLSIDKAALLQAIRSVKAELVIFAERLKKINVEEGLNIPDIDKLLVW